MSCADYFFCPLRLLDGDDQTLGPAARVQRRTGYWATGQLGRLAKGGKLKHRRKFQVAERVHSDAQGARDLFRDESWSRVIASWVGDRSLVLSDFCSSPATNLALTMISEANRVERAFLLSARACRDQRSCVARPATASVSSSVASRHLPHPRPQCRPSPHRSTAAPTATAHLLRSTLSPLRLAKLCKPFACVRGAAYPGCSCFCGQPPQT
jgi:hypothetical protein